MAQGYYQLEKSTQSLVDFFAKATSVLDEDFFRAKQECILARYALRDKMAVYESLKAAIDLLVEKSPEEALLMLARLDLQAERLIITVDKIVGLLKKASEIEILSNTKFDGVQLFHIVQQIPVIIADTVTSMAEGMLTMFLDDIIKNIDIDPNIKSQILIEIPVIAASFAKEIGDKLSQQMADKMKVLDNNKNTTGISEGEVEAMLGTVPLVENQPVGE